MYEFLDVNNEFIIFGWGHKVTADEISVDRLILESHDITLILGKSEELAVIIPHVELVTIDDGITPELIRNLAVENNRYAVALVKSLGTSILVVTIERKRKVVVRVGLGKCHITGNLGIVVELNVGELGNNVVIDIVAHVHLCPVDVAGSIEANREIEMVKSSHAAVNLNLVLQHLHEDVGSFV